LLASGGLSLRLFTRQARARFLVYSQHPAVVDTCRPSANRSARA